MLPEKCVCMFILLGCILPILFHGWIFLYLASFQIYESLYSADVTSKFEINNNWQLLVGLDHFFVSQ